MFENVRAFVWTEAFTYAHGKMTIGLDGITISTQKFLNHPKKIEKIPVALI